MGGCWAPLFSSLSALGQRPRSWGQARWAGQLSPRPPLPLMPRTEEETEAQGRLRPADVPQGRRPTSRWSCVGPWAWARCLQGQGKGPRATETLKSQREPQTVWSDLSFPVQLVTTVD